VIGRVAALVCLVLVASAHADTPEGRPRLPGELREAYERGDFATVRRLLLDMYTLEPRAEFLFALGQVELNLGNYQAAIRYYEKFIDSHPSDEQIALAQQAIGAARMRMTQPEDKPPEPPPERPKYPPRPWYAEDTGLVALGGAAIVVGAGLLYYSHRLGDDHSGSLADYDSRVKQSRTTMWTGVGVASAGAVVIGVTLVRWRLRPDGGYITASISPASATFAFTGRW
jgi:tetratricopeptide (TPR) repeat protein